MLCPTSYLPRYPYPIHLISLTCPQAVPRALLRCLDWLGVGKTDTTPLRTVPVVLLLQAVKTIGVRSMC